MDDLHTLLGSTDLAVDLHGGAYRPLHPILQGGFCALFFKPDSSRGKDRREDARAKDGASPGFSTV